ncbi:MAG: hypothetical protein ACI8RA_000277 [Chlamydiales bacterium]
MGTFCPDKDATLLLKKGQALITSVVFPAEESKKFWS